MCRIRPIVKGINFSSYGSGENDFIKHCETEPVGESSGY